MHGHQRSRIHFLKTVTNHAEKCEGLRADVNKYRPEVYKRENRKFSKKFTK